MAGNERLRAARLARPSPRRPGEPLSRAELAELVAATVHRRTERTVPLDAHYIAKLERAVIRRPGADYRAALAEVLNTDESALGFAPPPPSPPAGVHGVDTDGGLLALAAAAEVTEVGATAVEALERVIELLARAYARTPPAELLAEVQRRVAETNALLARRSTLAQRRRLLVAGGWLALLAATLHVDLGNAHHSATGRAVALSLGRETGHRELSAWAVEIEAWDALVGHDWPAAARLAAEGTDLAPRRSPAGVQLAAQHARAAARLGDAHAVHTRLAEVEHIIDGQTGGRPEDHHFRFDGRKLEGYTATALAWLNDPAGETVARTVVDRYRNGPARRLATARIDLGLILARAGRPDEAAELGLLAADSGQLVSSNRWRITELTSALADYRGVPEVDELRRISSQQKEG